MGRPDRLDKLLVGKVLVRKYYIEELLARGGMGLVYGARHLTTGRKVAIKLLRPELVTRTDFARRLRVEARLAVEAAHPNVVEVIDAGADADDTPFLVLERLYGQTLDALLAQPLSLLTTAQAAVPVMNALVALHAAGIVHRDVKPTNLFLSVEGDGRVTPKLLDFGIAKLLEGADATSSGVALGTPAYMAPEQALGCSTLGPAADVWSVGVVLMRCLTGGLPFDDKSSSRVGALRSGPQEAALVGLPKPVAAVLVEALRFEPAERFPSMSAFRAAWLDALRQCDPKQVWPGENSISYAPGESELGAGIDVARVRALRSTREQPQPGRSDDISTQTLAKLGLGSTRMKYPGLTWGLGLLLSVLTLWAVHARLSARMSHSPSASEEQVEALQSELAKPGSSLSALVQPPQAEMDLGSALADTRQPSRPEISPSARVASAARLSSNRPVRRPPLVEPSAGSMGSAGSAPNTPPNANATAFAEHPAADGGDLAPALGANRSPIIE
jgi:eukaryotic-like serine/threonine-protein kinase